MNSDIWICHTSLTKHGDSTPVILRIEEYFHFLFYGRAYQMLAITGLWSKLSLRKKYGILTPSSFKMNSL